MAPVHVPVSIARGLTSTARISRLTRLAGGSCLLLAAVAGAQAGPQPSASSATAKILDGFIQNCNYESIPDAWSEALPSESYGALRLKEVNFDPQGDAVLVIDMTFTGALVAADQARWGSLWGQPPRPGTPPTFAVRTFTRVTPSKAKETAAMSVASKGRELTVTCTATRSAPSPTPAASGSAASAPSAGGKTPCTNVPFFVGRFGADVYAICPLYQNGSGGPELSGFELAARSASGKVAIQHRADETPSTAPFKYTTDGIYGYFWIEKSLRTTLLVQCINTRECDMGETRLIKFVNSTRVSTAKCNRQDDFGTLPNGDPIPPCQFGVEGWLFAGEAIVVSGRKRKALMIEPDKIPKMLENAASGAR